MFLEALASQSRSSAVTFSSSASVIQMTDESGPPDVTRRRPMQANAISVPSEHPGEAGAKLPETGGPYLRVAIGRDHEGETR
jgi:hypothetical protein